jgi:hypothetical protein
MFCWLFDGVLHAMQTAIRVVASDKEPTFGTNSLHHASCATPEQQGREDNEEKGWRLAVDVKSDLC